MPTAVSPIVITREIDVSYVAPAISSTIVGLVGGATRGPINDPQYITSSQQFVETFGQPTTSTYLGYAALLYLQAGNQLWVNRVGALDGSDPYASATTDTAASLVSTVGLTVGASIFALNGRRIKLRFDTSTTKQVEILFATSMSTTLVQLCAQINSVLETGFAPKLGVAAAVSAIFPLTTPTFITIASQSHTSVSSSIEVIPPSGGDCAADFGWASGTTSVAGTKTIKAVIPNLNATTTGTVAVGSGYNFTVTSALVQGSSTIQTKNITGKGISLDIDGKGQVDIPFVTYSDPWDAGQIVAVINAKLVADALYGPTYTTFASSGNPSISGAAAPLSFDYSAGGDDVSFLITIGSVGPLTLTANTDTTSLVGLVAALNSKLSVAYLAAGGTIPLTGSEFSASGTKVRISSPQGFVLAAGGGATKDWLNQAAKGMDPVTGVAPYITPHIRPRTVTATQYTILEAANILSKVDYSGAHSAMKMTIGNSSLFTLALTPGASYVTVAATIIAINAALAAVYDGDTALTGTEFSLSGIAPNQKVVISSPLGFTIASCAGVEPNELYADLDPVAWGNAVNLTPGTYNTYIKFISPSLGLEDSSILVSSGIAVADLGLSSVVGTTKYGTGDNDIAFTVNGTAYSAVLQNMPAGVTTIGTAYIYLGQAAPAYPWTPAGESFTIAIGTHAPFSVTLPAVALPNTAAAASALNAALLAGYGSTMDIFSDGTGNKMSLDSSNDGVGATPIFVQITDGTPSLLTALGMICPGSTIWQMTHAPYSIPYTMVIPDGLVGVLAHVKIIDPTSPVIGTESEIEITDANTVLGIALQTVNGTDTETGALTFTATSPGTWANNNITVKVYGENIVSLPINAQRIEIYDNGTIAETYQMAVLNPLGLTRDGGTTYDDTYFIETLINDNSDYITVDFDETLVAGADLNKIKIKPTNAAIPSSATVLVAPYYMTGGLDGLNNLSANEIIGVTGTIPTGLQAFANYETIFLNLIAAPGFSTSSVILALINIAETRADVLAIVDPPFGLTPTEVVEWHNGTGGYGNTAAFNSSYAALYGTWVQYFDAYNNTNIWLPPSCFMLPVIANNDNTSEPWFAPAGLTRGKLGTWQALDINYNPTFGERELMYGNGNAVNPIVNFPQDGIVVWGQRTLQRIPSALDRINVRRLLLIARTIVRLGARVILFEPNDASTRKSLVNLINPLLQDIANRRGLQSFRVVDTTTARDISLNQIVIKVFLQPTQTAEIIDIPFIITSAGVA